VPFLVDFDDDVADHVLGRRDAVVELDAALDELLERCCSADWCTTLRVHRCSSEQDGEAVEVAEVEQLHVRQHDVLDRLYVVHLGRRA
jgi:hypothetical protein